MEKKKQIDHILIESNHPKPTKTIEIINQFLVNKIYQYKGKWSEKGRYQCRETEKKNEIRISQNYTINLTTSVGRVGKDQSSNKKCNKYLLAKCITKKSEIMKNAKKV